MLYEVITYLQYDLAVHGAEGVIVPLLGLYVLQKFIVLLNGG